jgi:phage shock protein PspC (stress-responsive transcriptional regulator)
MLLAADAATGQTIALLITFLGIGVLVNLLIVYIIAQVLGERKQNQERQSRTGH